MQLSPAVVMWFFFAAIFGGLLAVHYMQPERPPINPPGSRADPAP